MDKVKFLGPFGPPRARILIKGIISSFKEDRANKEGEMAIGGWTQGVRHSLSPLTSYLPATSGQDMIAKHDKASLLTDRGVTFVVNQWPSLVATGHASLLRYY